MRQASPLSQVFNPKMMSDLKQLDYTDVAPCFSPYFQNATIEDGHANGKILQSPSSLCPNPDLPLNVHVSILVILLLIMTSSWKTQKPSDLCANITQQR